MTRIITDKALKWALTLFIAATGLIPCAIRARSYYDRSSVSDVASGPHPGHRQDIERRVDAPCIGSLPLPGSVAKGARQPPVEYIVANPFSVFAQSFRNLKVSVVQSRVDGSARTSGGTVLAVTSPLTGEGKTTTSVCLGETSSLQGARPRVVDGLS
jgi:hypothetical protein